MTNHDTIVSALNAQIPLEERAGQPYIIQRLLDAPPLTPSDYVFLPAAVARVGKWKFGNAWADWERNTLHFPAPIKSPVTIEMILRAQRPPGPPPPMPSLVAGGRTSGRDHRQEQADYVRRKEDWKNEAPDRLVKAQATVVEDERQHSELLALYEQHRPGVEALHDAFLELSQAIIDGKVRVFGRNIEGGPMLVAKGNLFQREGLAPLMIRNGIAKMDKGVALYLFVERADLEANYPTEPKIAPPAGATLDRVSSYMRLGLHVAGLGFGRDFAGEKKEIIRSLFEHAPSFGLGEGKLTGPVAGYLATILREPDAQGGKRNRGKGKG